MRRALASLVAISVVCASWACAQAPADDGAADVVDAGLDHGVPVDSSEASVAHDAADASPPPADSAPPPSDAALDASPPVDAGSCAKLGGNQKCGVSPQCGCASNQTCDLTPSADTACVAPGLGAQGALCVNTGSCAQGLTCLYGGACHAFCSPSQPCKADAGQGRCIQLTDSNDAAVPGAALCEITCALSDPNACGQGAACYPSAMSDGGSDCARAGSGALNASCTYLSDCQAGLGCVGPAQGQGQCKKWCRVGTNDCGGTTSCGALNPALVIAGVQYGTCP